jgi:uncharacterized YccA/Bax inhibitor family protein
MAILNSTSNPAFTSYFWKRKTSSSKKMTVNGIIAKSLSGLLIVTATTAYIWKLFYNGTDVQWFLYGGMIAAVIFSVIISYKPYTARWVVLLYAVAKGCFLGAISVYAHKKFPELPFRAVAITFVTFFVMLGLYKLRIIKVTQQFKSVIITASATIFSIYFISWIFYFFKIDFPLVWGTSWFAILFNVIAAIVASLALLLDFDYIERQLGSAPKWKEWLATWGLLVTLIWLYIEVLRLLKKLAYKF